jgi:hypothetical protein
MKKRLRQKPSEGGPGLQTANHQKLGLPNISMSSIILYLSISRPYAIIIRRITKGSKGIKVFFEHNGAYFRRVTIFDSGMS